MEFFPIFLDIRDQQVVVVGGGDVASRKVNLLLNAGARVRVVSPEAREEVQALAEKGEIEWLADRYRADHLAGARLVMAATDQAQVNGTVAEDAKAAGIPVNVADQPERGSFITPSIIDRSPVMVAVSTGGAAPVLARLIRTRLEALIPAGYGRLGGLAQRYRDQVKARFGDVGRRRRFWEKVLTGGVAERVFAGDLPGADAAMERAMAATPDSPPDGEVYLVGAGPGDPDLISFRALRLMQQADVVVYDRLVSQPILEMTRRDADRVYVGKERNRHAMRQEEINRLLADLAKQGKRVLRLKGGDPFIFGRGGEEIDTLAEEGVAFQVIPAVTAASGCAAYSGIPLTHRDHAQSVTFVTGHLKDGTINLNWSQLAQPRQTVVFYMGLLGLPIIRDKLIEHGVSPEMPIALVQQGTTSNQRVFTGTLGNIQAVVEKEKPKPPTLIIVGEVVNLREKLNWYHSAPRSEADKLWAPLPNQEDQQTSLLDDHRDLD